MIHDEELVRAAKADREFLTSNASKAEREQWILDTWLLANGRVGSAVAAGADPPDVLVDGAGVEIVEAMPSGRRRGDEQKAKVQAALDGQIAIRRLPSLAKVRERGHHWIFDVVAGKVAKSYDPAAASQWTLLVYANFTWTEQVDWAALEEMLRVLPPPFARVDVTYRLAAESAAARTVFLRGSLPHSRRPA